MADLSSTRFQGLGEALAEKKIDLGTDTLKLALTNVAPTVSFTQFSQITEITGDGYTAGGQSVTVASSSQSAGTYSLVLSGTIEWKSTGTIGPFRYLVLYDADAVNDDLIMYWDIGEARTLNNGDIYRVDMDGTILTIA